MIRLLLESYLDLCVFPLINMANFVITDRLNSIAGSLATILFVKVYTLIHFRLWSLHSQFGFSGYFGNRGIDLRRIKNLNKSLED